MKEWRRYVCEFCEPLLILEEDTEPELENCRCGHEFIMVHKERGAGILVSLIPALSSSRKYHLKIESMSGELTPRISKHSFSKEDVGKLAQLFMGLESKAAERVWKAKKLS